MERTISTINGRQNLSAINHTVVSCLLGNRWTLHFVYEHRERKGHKGHEGKKCRMKLVVEKCIVELGRRVNQSDQLKMVSVQGFLIIGRVK